MTTNFLNFCRTGSAIDVAFVVGVLGVDCVAGVGKMYTWLVEGATGSGLLVAWVVAVGFNSVENGLRTCFLGSSTASFPLPSSVSNGEIASSCILYCSSTVVSIRHSFSGFSSF